MTTPAKRLADLAERFWRFECAESTMTAVLAGEKTDAPYIFRESAADYARRDAAAAAMLKELDAIPADALGAEDRATHGLLRRDLAAIRDQYAVSAHLRPWLLPVGPEFNTVFFANSTSILDAAAAELFVARLQSIPQFFGDLRANMAEGLARGIRYPRVVLETAAAAVRRLASINNPEDAPWYKPLKLSPAAASPAVKRTAERAQKVIGEEVLPALREYADFLGGPLLAGARETIACTDTPQGREYYKIFVRQFANTDDPPEAIHALGLAEVSRLQREMERVAADAGFAGDLPRYRKFLMEDAQFVLADKETLRERIEVLCKRIDMRIPAYFGRIPRITYGVESISPAMSATLPPAYAQPNPGDGSVAGVLWVSGLPDRCRSYLHVALALHEGWPGHLMHIALMQEAKDLPAFRRNGAPKCTACVEGWALYCETLGVEMGLYETPHQHYGRLEFEMWRAARLVVDTGIHWRGWSRAKAIDYMVAHLSLTRETIEQEVDRYIALPAQALAYQIGNLKIRGLRARAEKTLGDRFNVRDFHTTIMTAGAVTLQVLEETVDRWLAGETARAA